MKLKGEHKQMGIYSYDYTGMKIDSKTLLPNTIIVAASDSNENDKEMAKFVCSGTNDERTIQAAIDYIADNGGAGNIILCEGNYYIDEFYTKSGSDMKTAIIIPTSVNKINITGAVNSADPASYGIGTKINVTSTGLSFVTEQSALFNIASRSINSLFNNYSNMYIDVADISHPIICINNYYSGASAMKNMRIRQLGKGAGRIPAVGSVGIRCTAGNPSGIGHEITHVSCSGFYEGFQIGGEHIVATECLGRDCYYTYTFGNYEYDMGVMEHPITLINCADELSASLPLFNRCGDYEQTNKYGKQAITMIDYNIEIRPYENPTLSDILPAEEVTPGAFCGYISFAANDQARSLYNIPNVQFWKSGSGQNFKTVNSVHRLGGKTSTRSTYTPQYMQQYFDTTLNKLLIYNGTEWVDANGQAIS